jgi:hypothetical protein
MGLFDLFSGSAGKQAGQDVINQINLGKQEAAAQFGLGRDALTTNYAKGIQEWDPTYKTANAGESAYADAMGLNGPEGNARAQAGFQNNPAYKFQLQQGLAAAKAAAAKSGFTNSGNAEIDLQNYAQGQANQGWGDYISRLNPFLGQATAAAGARSNIDTGLGNALNASYTNEGQLDYGADTSIGQAMAGKDMADYNASKNLWGVGLGLAGDAAQFFGGGGAGKVKNLFGSFGAGASA